MFPKRIIYKTDSGSEEDLRIYTVACIIWYNIIYLRKIYKDNSNKRRTYLQRISHTKYKNKLVNLHQRPTKRWQVKVNKKKLSPFPVFFPPQYKFNFYIRGFSNQRSLNYACMVHGSSNWNLLEKVLSFMFTGSCASIYQPTQSCSLILVL